MNGGKNAFALGHVEGQCYLMTIIHDIYAL